MTSVIVDTGPWVALLDRQDHDHEWAKAQARLLPPKMMTCEAVLSEVHFLTQGISKAKNHLARWLADGWLDLPFSVSGHHASVHELMSRYASLPMSFADACLVKISELWPDASIFTLDSHFRIYRRNKRQSIPLVCR